MVGLPRIRVNVGSVHGAGSWLHFRDFRGGTGKERWGWLLRLFHSFVVLVGTGSETVGVLTVVFNNLVWLLLQLFVRP